MVADTMATCFRHGRSLKCSSWCGVNSAQKAVLGLTGHIKGGQERFVDQVSVVTE